MKEIVHQKKCYCTSVRGNAHHSGTSLLLRSSTALSISDRDNEVVVLQGLTSYSLAMKKVKGSFYIAQYPVCWTAQIALHFLPSLADLFIPTPTRLLREAF